MRPTRTISLAAFLMLTIVGVLGLSDEAHAQIGPGTFATNPAFNSSGTAFAVFGGGSLAQLEAAAQAVQASGVWAQDSKGAYQLLVVSGPAFLRAPVAAAFPVGFTGPTAVTLVRSTSAPVPPSSTPTPASVPFGQTVAQFVIQKTNEQRAANGLATLQANALLNGSAAAYAQVVFERDPYLSSVAGAHDLDGQPWDRATRVGYAWSLFAENVATASGTTQPEVSAVAQTIVNGWMNSPSHRANILTAEYVDTGVGCATGRPASVRSNLAFVVLCVAVYGTPR